MEREEIRRRLKAARAYAGFTKPTTLAQQPLLVKNGITASRIVQTEAMNRDARPMELECIAAACGLPTEWFTAPFERLAEPERGLLERLEALAQQVERLSSDRLRQEAARQAAEDASADDPPDAGDQRRAG